MATVNHAQDATKGSTDLNDDEVLTFNEKNIAEFRATGGRLSSFGDAPVLLLTTTGAKTGRARTSPMMYLPDDDHPDRVYVFASAAGADTNPAWFQHRRPPGPAAGGDRR